MRKFLHIILLLVLPLLSCVREEMAPEVTPDGPEGRVKLYFTVTGDQLPATKALGEDVALDSMHVAVFGSSGYLKEYVPAEIVSQGTTEYHFTDYSGNPVVKTVPQFTFTVSLTLSTTARRIHFIGNGPASIPFGRDYEVLPVLLGKKETGYWQMFTLPGIYAKQDADGNYINPQGGIRQSGEPYVPADETQAAFQNVPLIRNWAKIVVTTSENSNFTPYSFAVVNVPSQGTLVPYGGVQGFITNYKDLSFDELRSEQYNYAGNLPSTVPFDNTVPEEEDFVNFTNGVKQYSDDPNDDSADHSVYMYERPIPDANISPSYVILYGRYKNPDDTSLTDEEKANGVMCYYKVDLMSGSEYYPVLRNFKYQISVDKITAKGHATPAAAAAAAGSADVSADINASTLPDISDGTRRMAVQPWMSHTYIHAQGKQEQLYVVFYDDINADVPVPNKRPECVTYELIPENGGIVKDVTIGAAVNSSGDDNGWRPISFAIASPEEASARTQTLRIKCKTNPDDVDESPLYRDVVISLLPRQPMRISFSSPRILRAKGSPLRVDISIPDGLVESMFPLVFAIEAREMTLTPDNTVSGNNMPVISAPSITGDERQAFHFRRTLTWDEYRSLASQLDFEDESRWRTFSSYFKTNCDESATRIYVGNDFFLTGDAEFVNYESFSNPKFSTSIPYTAESPVTVTASMMIKRDTYDDTVLLELTNLKPADSSWLPEASGKYAFHPTAQDMSFSLLTTAEGGDVSVTLSTENDVYEPVTLVPWHFSNVSFVDAMPMPSNASKASNVAFGHVNSDRNGKTVLFGYSTDPANPTPTVRMIIPNPDASGMQYPSNYKSASGVDLSKSTLHGNSYTGDANYYWIEMNTNQNTKNTNKVSFVLSSPGYVEENVETGRFEGNVFTWDYNAAALKKNWSTTKLWYELDKTEVNQKRYFRLTFDAISAVGDSGIKLEKGGVYELTANIYNTKGNVHSDTDTGLFCIIFEFALDSDNIPLRPGSVLEPMVPEDCTYYQYLGSDNTYLWTFPQGTKEASLRFKALNSRDIVIKRIIGKAFRGTLHD